MEPVVATTTAMGQQQQTTANNGWKNGIATGATSDWVPIANPFRSHSITVGGFLEDETSLLVKGEGGGEIAECTHVIGTHGR